MDVTAGTYKRTDAGFDLDANLYSRSVSYDTTDGTAGDVVHGVARVAAGAATGALQSMSGVSPTTVLIETCKILQRDNASLRRQVETLQDRVVAINESLSKKEAMLRESALKIELLMTKRRAK